jgi:hypothetical protein
VTRNVLCIRAQIFDGVDVSVERGRRTRGSLSSVGSGGSTGQRLVFHSSMHRHNKADAELQGWFKEDSIVLRSSHRACSMLDPACHRLCTDLALTRQTRPRRLRSPLLLLPMPALKFFGLLGVISYTRLSTGTVPARYTILGRASMRLSNSMWANRY